MVRQHTYRVGWLAWAASSALAGALLVAATLAQAQGAASSESARGPDASWHCIGNDLMKEQEFTFGLKYSAYNGMDYSRVEIVNLGPSQHGYWKLQTVVINDGQIACGDSQVNAYVSLVDTSLQVYAECASQSVVLEARCVPN